MSNFLLVPINQLEGRLKTQCSHGKDLSLGANPVVALVLSLFMTINSYFYPKNKKMFFFQVLAPQ